jgi:hypothetical protein
LAVDRPPSRSRNALSQRKIHHKIAPIASTPNTTIASFMPSTTKIVVSDMVLSWVLLSGQVPALSWMSNAGYLRI